MEGQETQVNGEVRAAEVEEVPHPQVVQKTQEVAISTMATTAFSSLATLKWPYRVCLVGQT